LHITKTSEKFVMKTTRKNAKGIKTKTKRRRFVASTSITIAAKSFVRFAMGAANSIYKTNWSKSG